MITHEFVLCSKVPAEICFSGYEKKDMIIISDDFISANQIHFSKIKMYCQYIGNEIDGLDYHGITIITSEMAIRLRKELTDYCNHSNDLNMLIAILDEAIAIQGYVIHFGV